MIRKTQKITKGTPTAVLISILIHAGLFLLAGMFVVFTVVKQKEVEFAPPKPVERPKMKLKKPKVRVRKTAKPKPTTRIVTKVQKASMPDIQLPEMSDMGEGLGDVDLGGFDLASLGDLSTIVGNGISAGNDLVGTFYSVPTKYGYETYRDLIRKFIRHEWNPYILSRYYRSPKKLYASMIVVPEMMSSVVPEAFGEDPREHEYWLILYKGRLVYPEDITFRFVAGADSTVAVRVDGEVVLGAQWHSYQDEVWSGVWASSSADNRKWWMGNWTACVGDWVTLKANEAKNIEILIGDGGGLCCLMLAAQVKGQKYEIRPGGGPRLPAFKTAYPSRDLQDLIIRDMVPGEISLTNGPIFSDIQPASPGSTAAVNEKSETSGNGVEMADDGSILAQSKGKMRTWTTKEGKVFEGEFVLRVGDKVVLKDVRGRQKKVPVATLSTNDIEYVELSNPPELKVSVSSTEKQVFAYKNKTKVETIGYEKIYTGKVRKWSAGPYKHELTAEFFAIGVQRYADVYILLDHQTSTFRLTKENNESYEFSGKPVRLRKIIPRAWENADFTVRGEKDYGYLIVVKDERGEIIAHKSTSPWLFENYERLKALSVGWYMDKTARRTYPVGPPRARY